MPESTTSQSPQEVYISSGSDQWSQGNSSTMAQNGTNNLEWNALPNQNIVPVTLSITNPGFIPNGFSNNAPIQYGSAPNYMNVPNSQLYQRHHHSQNGYPVISIPNTQSVPTGPVLVDPNQRGPALPNTWATQQNFKLIQTAWNKPSSGGVKKQKRVRTAFTSHQMMELEQEYARTRYLDRSRRIELAEMLRLNERTIKIWFQNRRMKEKKDRTESLEEIEDVTTTQSPSELGVPMFHDQYQANNEQYNRMGMFVEQYPVSSTTAPMTSMPEAPMPQAPMPQAQPSGSYPTYSIPEARPPQYQQVHLQMEPFSTTYCEVQELSPESTPQSESSASVENSAPKDIVEQNWDLSWIRSIEAAEEC